MLTKEEYDSFEEGDIIIVAAESNFNSDEFVIKTGTIYFSKNSNYLGKPEKCSTGVNWSLPPQWGGLHLTLLKHTPKPKPAWHSAKAIKTKGGNVLLNLGNGWWIDAFEQKITTDHLEDSFGKIDIVVA